MLAHDPSNDVNRAGRRVLMGLLLLAAAYAALLALLWGWQEQLLFRPAPLAADQPIATAPDIHERFVDVPGARLSVLELRLAEPRGVVFYLHGNAGNLQSWFVNTDFYRRAGYDLVMPDYRGYGKSSGRIVSEAQLHADMQAVWQQVAPRYAGKHVVFMGRSLGTGLAATLAAEVQPDLTVLISPYSSMKAVAALHYPWVPAALLRYPLRTDALIGRIQRPVVLVHGERDTLIPPSHSQALLQAAHQAREVLIPGAAHGDLQDFEDYRRAIADALSALR
jgi:hypothetical protein